MANCKSKFDTNEEWNKFNRQWRQVVCSSTIAVYTQRWNELRLQYNTERGEECIRYLQQEWLKEGQKERLVSAWTSQYKHFGITTTSR